MDKPIPAFYACYLLRSTIRHASLYVGSTPNPVRRLKQHNGESKGGAVRTSKDSLRPWEMTCLVTGFPSKIAALQFEWAWQNTHMTRHVSPSSRISRAPKTARISPRTGRLRTRSAKPRVGLTDRLANLHLLLRSSSFQRWPLNVTFFAEDVWRVWCKWTGQQIEGLREGVVVTMDGSMRQNVIMDHPAFESEAMPRGIHALDVGYGGLKAHVEKCRGLLDDKTVLSCSICRNRVPEDGSSTLICPGESCQSVAHIDCLASTFLAAEKRTTAMVPTSGCCPGCGDRLQWVDLVKELSLRMRGEKELTALFKPVRGKKRKTSEAAANIPDAVSEMEESSEDELPGEDEWHGLPESSDVEVEDKVTRSDPSPPQRQSRLDPSLYTAATRSEPVTIEDSDWSDAEIIT